MKHLSTLLFLSSIVISTYSMTIQTDEKQLIADINTALHTGHDLNTPYPGYAEPFIRVSTKLNVENATLKLLRHGVAPNPRTTHEAFSPLHWAIRWGNLKVIEKLLESHADLDEHTNVWEDTPLMHAVEWARVAKINPTTHAAMVQLLLTSGADNTRKNVMNKTAADIAKDRYPELAKLIRLYDSAKETLIFNLSYQIDKIAEKHNPTNQDYVTIIDLLRKKTELCRYHPYHTQKISPLIEQTESVLRRLAAMTENQKTKADLYSQMDIIQQ